MTPPTPGRWRSDVAGGGGGGGVEAGAGEGKRVGK